MKDRESTRSTAQMSKLLGQIAKFGVVGVVCFLIDFGVYSILNRIFWNIGFAEAFPYYYLISKFVSVAVSMVCNYLLSMKFVFTRKDDMSRKTEFVIFAVLSVIGLVLAEIILYLGMDVLGPAFPALADLIAWFGGLFGLTRNGSEETCWVLVSTAIVMCYNFVSRKLLLEKKE